MFSLDRWQEVLSTLGRAKLRSALTAFAVAWGIFMLVVLLGLGKGLRHSAESMFRDDATNSVWIWAGQASRPYQGLPVGRRVQLTNGEYDVLRGMDGVEHLTGRFFPGQGWGDRAVRVGAKTQSYDVRSVHPDHLYLEKTTVVAGRFINDADIAEKRKVAVVGIPVATFFWRSPAVIGNSVEIGGVSFQVVGVFDDAGGNEDETKLIYVPVTTAQLAWNGADRLNQLLFTVGDMSVDETNELIAEIKQTLSERLRFDPEDPQALRVRNTLEQFQNFQKIFSIIELFITFMGACTLFAGIIGVSNIMMIAVKERTKEIGVRKALGATPWTIVGTILQESVFLTAAAGYLGLVGGVAVISVVPSLVPDLAGARVDLEVAVWANIVLVTAGALAGFFPARAAAKVSPVVAMRDT